MPYALGVDVGNSFTAAAIVQANDRKPVPDGRAVPLGVKAPAIPSVAFVSEDGSVLVGEDAEAAGVNSPERVVREFRQRIGDPVPICIPGNCVAAEEVYAAVVHWVVARAAELEGEPADAVALTYPASWVCFKLERVRRALAAVGLSDATLISEPEAAFRNYAVGHPDQSDRVVAIYDLGGTTCDVTIVERSRSGGIQLLGEPGHIDRVGGAEFDDRLFRLVADRSEGALNTNEAAGDAGSKALSALRRDCAAVKECLSFRFEASVPVGVTVARLVRTEFEAAIHSSVRSTIDVFHQALVAAQLTAEDLDAVLLVGGSSQIPLVRSRIAEEFDRPIVLDGDPMGACAVGAALAAAADLSMVREEPRGRPPAVQEPVALRGRSRRPLRSLVALANLRFRPNPRAVQLAARAVPVAVAAVIAGLVITVVVAQGSSFGALPMKDGEAPAADTGEWLPESLRSDGFGGLPFASDASARDDEVDGSPFFTPPPSTRVFQPAPDRTGSASPRQGASDRQAAPHSPSPGSANPAPEPAPSPIPAPAPEPTPQPVPNPQPAEPQPQPQPEPEPVPEPDPAPLPDPDPDPVPVPVPAPVEGG